MRYAFYMKELEGNKNELVAKLPKNINPKSYNVETMAKDIET